MRKQEQYRPSFSLAELDKLLSYIPESSPLYSKLKVYLLKVNVGLNCAAYIKTGEQEKRTLAAQVGLEADPALGEDHLENQRLLRNKLDTQARLAPQLMSDEDRLEYLAQRSVEEIATPEEIEEGRALELKIHGMSFGMFD